MGDEPKCIIHKRMISFYFHKEIEQINYVAVFWLIGETDPGEFKKRKECTVYLVISHTHFLLTSTAFRKNVGRLQFTF